MKLTQVKGNTYVFEGWEFIPLYKTDDTHCILMDTGLTKECIPLDEALAENNLTPIGIFGSHTHSDHSANHAYFQKKYGIPVAMPVGEAGLCANLMAIKSYFHIYSPNTAKGIVGNMVLDTDVLIGHEDGPFEFMGVTFEVIHTPGHSPDHISVVTPDGVCYVGDALLSGKMLEAKMPHNFSHEAALDTYELLGKLKYETYILAHRGIFTDLTELVAVNRQLILDRADMVYSLVDKPMNMSEIQLAVAAHFHFSTSKPLKAAMIEHNTQAYVEYLIDRGDLEAISKDGIRYYQRTARES